METLMPALNETSKALYLGEVMADLLVFAFALAQWSWSGTAIFVFLLGLSVATGAMKVVLPCVQGNLSASYVFLMWGIVRLSLGETLLIGCAASLVQTYWHCKRKPTAIQLLFNLSVISLSIGVGS